MSSFSMERPIRILIIEDNPDDAFFMIRQMRQCSYEIDFKQVQAQDEFTRAIQNETWDVIVSDYMLPSFTALDALRIYRENNLNIPFIIVSGVITDEIANEAMKAGASDFFKKDNIVRLCSAIERELHQSLSRQASTESEKKLRDRLAALEKENALLKRSLADLDRGGSVPGK
jgi:DNA-binding NtrC family response regulator